MAYVFDEQAKKIVIGKIQFMKTTLAFAEYRKRIRENQEKKG